MARVSYSLNSYTGGATAATVVATGIGITDTVITITGTNSTWSPLGTVGGFYLAVDYGVSSEEKIFVPSGSWTYSQTGITFSGITRGIDGTSAVVHSGGGYVTPIITALDTDEANFVSSIFLGNNPTPVSGYTINGTLGLPDPVYNATTNSGQLSVGGLTFSDVNNLASFTSSGNNYTQITVQNTTSGTAASASFVANNNLATSGNHFVEFGINSYAFTGAGVFNSPNAAWVVAASGELGLGNYYGGGIHFVVSGMGTAPIDSIVVSGNGTIGINGAVTLSGSLVISGSVSPTYSMPPSYVAPYKAWTYDPILSAGTLTMITGTAYYTAIWVPQPITLSGISFYTGTFAATDTAYVGFFSNTTQLATCSGIKGTGTNGLVTALISGGTYNLSTPGLYYVGIVMSGSTASTIADIAGVNTILTNMNIGNQTNALTGLRVGSVVIGQRALYGTGGTVSGTIAALVNPPFFALS